MQILWIAKFLSIGVGASAVATVGVFMYHPDMFGYNTTEPFKVYGITSDSTTGSPTLAFQAIKLNADITKRNYKCKLTGFDNKLVDCDLEFFNLDTSNKVTSQSELNQTLSSAETPDQDKLKTQYKPIKVTFQGSFLDWEKLGKKIEIVSTADASKIYGSFTPMFATHGDEILGKSEYFLGLTKSDSFTFASGDTYQCSFGSATSTQHSCEVYKPNATEQDKTKTPETLQSDGKLAKQESAISNGAWLVVKITDSSFNQELVTQEQDITIHVTRTPATPPSSPTEVVLIQSSSIFVADTAATDSKHIFLTQ